MKKGNLAVLNIKKMLCAGVPMRECEHTATVLQYDEKKECIFFLLQTGTLTDISLDALYNCRIQTEKEYLDCTGRITDRYCGMEGKTFKFQIENGFYKINLK